MEIRNFTFSLKNEKLKSYEKISWLLILLNLSFFLFLGLKYSHTANAKWFFTGSILVTLSALYSFIGKKYRNREQGYSFAFAASAFIWFEAALIWIGIVNIVLMLFEIISKRKLEILVNDTFISYPSFPKKEIEWHEISNLILKDGILTIDLKNNKLIQVNVEESAALVDEKEFNDFCKSKLS